MCDLLLNTRSLQQGMLHEARHAMTNRNKHTHKAKGRTHAVEHVDCKVVQTALMALCCLLGL